MLNWVNKKIDISFIVNPFYIYCMAFSFAIFVYMWGWSNLFPDLSAGLICFLIVTFTLFLIAGYKFGTKKGIFLYHNEEGSYLDDIIFLVILVLGFINVGYMGYLPILDRSHDYRDFGMPIIDTFFNTLSIFFSVYFIQSYLSNKNKKILLYVSVILFIQILIFRRSTIVWIITSALFLFILHKQKVTFLHLLAGIIFIPIFSFFFGLYGNIRSNLSESFVIDDLEASDAFIRSGVHHNHYMTYLYIASPLANLQKNIIEGDNFDNRRDLKDLFFYCLVPESLTMRLEEPLGLKHPDCNLITHELIVGTFFMISYYTMGWAGMIIMFLFLYVSIVLCLFVIKRWNAFSVTTLALLTTTVFLMIFSNFLNRLDVILMLFIYPVFFHLLFTRNWKKVTI